MSLPLFLLVVPQNRFCEQQLFDLKKVLERESGKCVILSKSGKKIQGEEKTQIEPDGMLVDWNRYLEGKQKYDAVVVIGGKGSKGTIWNDSILPQILTDHFRAGKILGAFGLSVVALARAGLVSRCEVSAINDDDCLKELNDVGAFPEEKNLVTIDKIITSNTSDSGEAFGMKILELLEK
tara:strand:- start:185 stop:724 length:540 start_codon:yes stop_codon:yes gene_type:complete